MKEGRIFYIQPGQIDFSQSTWKDNPPVKRKEGGWPVSEEALREIIQSGAKLRLPLREKLFKL